MKCIEMEVIGFRKHGYLPIEAINRLNQQCVKIHEYPLPDIVFYPMSYVSNRAPHNVNPPKMERGEVWVRLSVVGPLVHVRFVPYDKPGAAACLVPSTLYCISGPTHVHAHSSLT